MTTTGARIGAVVAAGAAAVAALVVVGPLLGSSDADGDDAPPVTTETTPTTQPLPPRTEPSQRMTVAAAAVRALVREHYPSDALWVRDAVCSRWHPPGNRDCTRLTEQEMGEFEQLLPNYAIEWVGSSRALERGGGYLGRPYVAVDQLRRVAADGGFVFVVASGGGPLDCTGGDFRVILNPGVPPVVASHRVSVNC